VLRVLHVAQPVDAGVARCVTDFATDQRAHGLDARVACPPSGPLPDWLRAAGVPVLPWPATRSPGPSVAGEARRLAALVRAADPDVVHLHSAKAGLAGRLALRGRRPTVFQPHAWSFAAVTGGLRTASLAWERAAARWAHVVVCVSDGERADGETHGVRARSWAVVPNGVDLDRFRPGDRAAARAALGLPAGPLAVCVGRLSRQKGQDVLLAAWPSVRVEGAALALVGDGPDHAALAAAAPPGVRFAGRSEDVRPWYAAADVVVVPSRWEGMALTALEGLACDRPVVASDVTGMREVAGGVDVVPPGDPAALAAALTERLRTPPAPGVARAAAERHDLRATTAAIRAVYERL
jgi:glycosyltransferase involved in cell wall biosynthesis